MSSSSEIFRYARPDEVEELAELAKHSFATSARDLGWWIRHLADHPHGGVESLWVAEDAGRPVAFCQLLSMKQWIGGRALPIMGLGTVSVAPDRRRRGLASRLLTSGLRASRERGDVASALYPFRVGYYREFGYGLAGEAHQYLLPATALPHDRNTLANVELVRNDKDRDDVLAVYEAGARRTTGQIDRTSTDWLQKDRLKDGVAAIYRDITGTATGYAIVRYRTDLPPDDRWLEVDEQMWLTDDARSGILAWLRSLGDQWPMILYRAHPDDGFENLITEPRLPRRNNPGWQLWFPSATLLRGPMFRLLDVERAFAMRSVQPGPDLSVTFRIRDESLSENDRDYKFEFSESEILAADTAGSANLVIETNIETLSQLFIGAAVLQEGVSAGRVVVDSPELVSVFDQRMRVPRPWTFERF